MDADEEKSLVAERAVEWLQRLETAGPEERAEFWKWLTESPLHVQEVLAAKACHTVLTHLFRSHRIDADTLLSGATNLHEIERYQRANGVPRKLSASRVKVIANSDRLTSSAPEIRARRESRFLMRLRLLAALDGACSWKIAASISAITLGILLTFMLKVIWIDRSVVTAATEWRTLQLADGSVLQLAPQTKLRLDFGDRRRFVYLSFGEAIFQVAKDPSRPFVVNTDRASVLAVGTRFAVNSGSDKVVVTVAEGVVAVVQKESLARSGRDRQYPDGRGQAPSVSVAAGEQLQVVGASVPMARNVDVTNELAWAQGRLIFDTETVGEAVSQINRYNRIQIEISDPLLAARAIRGVFRADDPESFAQSVAAVAPARILRSKPLTLRIEPQTGSAEGDMPKL